MEILKKSQTQNFISATQKSTNENVVDILKIIAVERSTGKFRREN